ncbi:uncharacterized protein B0J16DRAFT_397325 [Fusarium flagelliforme]|uniref:Norsolorinic acid reductase a n=1 Tax=Fusarium flagelliforme TaxID=2675880 RepID=A0A395MHF9_9HYPO|nr:uncharacterized protein B0J16DRAFT_397325 [Fusarium flagelliforme]KAH7189325.1 hypothetical protein B0J16DRAFT_397325 [Fusarium flagelliforme]RFN47337.1 norsolorinic acid reductase a [Fusarium flagelliforme]
MESAENITRHQLLLQSLEAAILDNFDKDDDSSPKHHSNRTSSGRACISQDINEEIEIPESWIGEFARVKLIPETPQKKIGQKWSRDSSQPADTEDQHVQVREPLRLERRHKKRRTESIRSTQRTEYSENSSGDTSVADEWISDESPPPEPPSLGEPTVTKLRPVPRGAPRIIERQGKFTIRRGVRIRDYRMPGPVPWPRAALSNSLEYQCRDGFNEKEASLGYPKPMVARRHSVNHQEMSFRNNRPHLLRSPSLGIANLLQDFGVLLPSEHVNGDHSK